MPVGKNARCAGFTLIEALIYLVFGGMVVAVIHSTVLDNQRAFTEQKSMASVQGSLRNAMMLLTGELQSVSPAGGDLALAAPNEIGIRAARGAGIICAPLSWTNQPTYTIAFATGTFEAEAADSVLVLATRGVGLADDEWRVLKMSDVTTWGGGKGYTCDWPVSVQARTRLTMVGDTAGVGIGSPVKPFRQLSFGLFSDGGRWWLGRRLRGAGWETLAGPLLSPADSGLVFRYMDGSGADVTAPADVAAVEILMRARRPGFEVRIDSLRTTVALRG